MEEDDLCTLRLGRGLGGGERMIVGHKDIINTKKSLQSPELLLLGWKGVQAENCYEHLKRSRLVIGDKDGDLLETGDAGRVSMKKMKLSEEQLRMLEDRFSADIYLTACDKQELAQKLNLNARQVDVWFQNRRARTKVKNTELGCEYLRNWCVRLEDENRRLKRDLQELREGNASQPLCSHLPKMPSTNTFSDFASKAGTSLDPVLNNQSCFSWAGEEVIMAVPLASRAGHHVE